MSQPPLPDAGKNEEVEHDVPAVFHVVARVAMLSHYGVFQRTTERPIREIMNSTTSSEAQANILKWCRRKTSEANYVQVAGAVMFASVVSCLGWDAVPDSHWSGPALWYASILLALASIFSAAQQSLSLPSQDSIKAYRVEQIENFRYSLADGNVKTPSWITLFAWQAPIMLMAYSVASFVIGMCVVVTSPLARNPVWDGSAKTVVLFYAIVLYIAISAAITTATIRRLKVE